LNLALAAPITAVVQPSDTYNEISGAEWRQLLMWVVELDPQLSTPIR
jgi:hypothetical protein